MFAQGIELLPEPEVPGGKTDFVLIASVANKLYKITVEIKDAHSKKLFHGIQTQLPEYVRRQRSDFGIYCVLFYGDTYPVSQTAITEVGCNPSSEMDEWIKVSFVMTAAMQKVSTPVPIKNVMLNLSQPTNPSKL